MKCPCLRETVVQSCSAAAIRKLIASRSIAAGEKCTSREFATCPVYAASEDGDAASELCPFLQEKVVQYCAASSAPHYVPWSEHSFSRCGASGHRYCELYLQMAGAGRVLEEVEGIDVSPRLRYTRNHFWFDAEEDGWWHAGIDGLLARALGSVDAITFISSQGLTCPSVIVSAGGSDYTLTFPHKVHLVACNWRLRADPGRLTRAPYTYGWLFEGTGGIPGGLLDAGAARDWMAHEVDRSSRALHAGLGDHPADGGVFAKGALRELDRETALRFFHQMFSPLGGDL